MHGVTSLSMYIIIGKLRENSIKFQIKIQLEPNFVPHVLSNLSF